MEEKHIRKKTLNCDSLLVIAETYINAAKELSKQNKYDEAIYECTRAFKIYAKLVNYRELGTCYRMVGEIYMWKSDYDEALNHQNSYLAVARQENDLVEQQRATASLGITYLLQSQDFIDDEKSKQALIKAEKAFIESYGLCEKLSSTISNNDVTDMKLRLRINFALLQEFLGNFDKAMSHLDKAIDASSSKKKYEMLLNCYMIKSKLYDYKWKDYSEAFECLNNAIMVAQKMADKDLKICQVLVAMATVCCKMSCYDRALELLLEAGKLDTPDKEKIEASVNIVKEMSKTLRQLNSINSEDYITLKGHYEKLGDSSSELLDFISAEKFYLYMLNCAEKAGLNGKELAPCYISLGQTYKDMACYDKALDYYLKEYELMKDDPKEAYESLSDIAELLYLDKKPYHMIEEYCNKAREAAQKCKKVISKEYEVSILKNLLKYQQKYGEEMKMDFTKLRLRQLGCDKSNTEHVEKMETSIWGNAVCTMDNLNAGVLIGTSKTECKNRSYAVKRNGLGESQLHLACKSGKTEKVLKLISENHPINIRDNAGWLPLHEACLKGHKEIVEIFIRNGADVNDKGGKECQGATPLIDAANQGYLEVVELLLEKGANPSLKSDLGFTPLEVLKNWRKKNNLTPDQEILYENLCNKMNPPIKGAKGDEISDIPQESTRVNDQDIAVKASPAYTSIFSKDNSQLLQLKENLLFDYRHILSTKDNSKVAKSKALSITERKMSDITGQKRPKITKRISSDNNKENSEDESQYTTDSNDTTEPSQDLLGTNELFACTRENDHKVVIRKGPLICSNNKANTQSAVSDMDVARQTLEDDDQPWNHPGSSQKPHIAPPQDHDVLKRNDTTGPSLLGTSPTPCTNGDVDINSAESVPSTSKVQRSSNTERFTHQFLDNEVDINSTVLVSDQSTNEHNCGDCTGITANPPPSNHQPSNSKPSDWTIIGYKIVDSLKGIENILDKIANRYCS